MDTDIDVAADGEVLAGVRGPDGGACMRRHDDADDAWVAPWNGDEAHPPDATGMLAAIVAPLAAGKVPVWVAASFDGDIVMIPGYRTDEAFELLRSAGHVAARRRRGIQDWGADSKAVPDQTMG